MSASEIKHHKTQVGDVLLHWVSVGDGAETVVLLHGFPQHWLMWRRVIPLLAERYTVVALDQRGMGGSSITRAGYDKKNLAADLFGLLTATGTGPVHLVGYDLGGGTAYAFASEHPELVRTLTIAEYAPPGYGYEYGMQPVRDWQSWQLAFFTVPDVAMTFIAGRERELLSWYFWHWSADPDAIDTADFERYVRELQKPGALRAGMEYFAAVFDDTEQVKVYAKTKLRMPVLAIGGAQGAAQFPEQAMMQLADHVTGKVLDGAGHWIADERPNELARLLLAHFAQT